jgi:hypothetical protein
VEVGVGFGAEVGVGFGADVGVEFGADVGVEFGVGDVAGSGVGEEPGALAIKKVCPWYITPRHDVSTSIVTGWSGCDGVKRMYTWARPSAPVVPVKDWDIAPLSRTLTGRPAAGPIGPPRAGSCAIQRTKMVRLSPAVGVVVDVHTPMVSAGSVGVADVEPMGVVENAKGLVYPGAVALASA